jgi:hypothetical protein
MKYHYLDDASVHLTQPYSFNHNVDNFVLVYCDFLLVIIITIAIQFHTIVAFIFPALLIFLFILFLISNSLLLIILWVSFALLRERFSSIFLLLLISHVLLFLFQVYLTQVLPLLKVYASKLLPIYVFQLPLQLISTFQHLIFTSQLLQLLVSIFQSHQLISLVLLHAQDVFFLLLRLNAGLLLLILTFPIQLLISISLLLLSVISQLLIFIFLLQLLFLFLISPIHLILSLFFLPLISLILLICVFQPPLLIIS